MEAWASYFYIYGIGGFVFFATLLYAWFRGALSKPKRLLPLLLGGFAFYLLLHGMLQAAGGAGALPETGTHQGTKETILAGWDVVVVLVYFGGIVGAGAYFARFTRTTSDYFFGGRRFSGWLLAVSCVATTIGAYSFVKYSSRAFTDGIPSSMTYLNDWFWMPLWMLVWLPIIYYGRIESVPEYFERRFGPVVRTVATAILLGYLVGYIGINFLTLGKALNALTGWAIFGSACLAATATAIYVTVGGQTSVIMTDLAQGIILLIVGLTLFAVGIDHPQIGGLDLFWSQLPDRHQLGLATLNRPEEFHAMGVFWQDAMAGGIAFYFMNQGILMRFMSARSVDEGRKAIALVALVVMPLAAISVSGVGWIGRAMAEVGVTFQGTELATIDPDNIFVIVTNLLTAPGIFGLVMATLTAALMSTADTLLTAVSAILVNDIWRPYIKGEDRGDAADLGVARISTLAAACVGIGLVPLFNNFQSIYVAHATFVAAIVPPMAVALVTGALWPRYNTPAALLTLVGGCAAVAASVVFPETLIGPLAPAVEPGGEGPKAYKYMRAAYGILAAGSLAVVGTYLFEEYRSSFPTLDFDSETEPLLVAGPEKESRRAFKGAAPKEGGETIELHVDAVDEPARTDADTDEVYVRLHPADAEQLGADPEDLLHVSRPGFWHGGLLSTHGRVDPDPGSAEGRIEMPEEILEVAGLADGQRAVVHLIG